ncbi:MAG: serine/threonine-protein kinase [Acidobacteriota bacterium]
MDLERWRRIEELFHRAVELPEGERPRFLAELPDTDPELRDEVASLLRSHAEQDDPVVEAVERSLRDVAEGSSQQTFGPYRARRRLAGGTQADVYLAERTDGEYRTQVAIKVAKRGFPTEELRRRFRQERQILASLSHPNIARLLDGGTTADGLPFLVMDYVDGQPIDRYCDQAKCSIRQRLELFRAVCEAVEHAHRNLTIHRDLKPSNILVTEDGQPVLLDFGIAKLLAEPSRAEPSRAEPSRAEPSRAEPSRAEPSRAEPSHADASIRTMDGLRFLTPAYASPEQVLGQQLTTSTDIYSLGVVLYRLLAGRPPYELDSLEPKALYEAVCERRPPAPSQALNDDAATRQQTEAIAAARGTSFSALRQRLKGDLDTITLEALRKEPERRYPTVAALIEDLDRTLSHRPISARRESARYRFTKLVRRHPYGVAATAALVLAIAIGVLATLRATWQAREQRDRAQASQAEAERVTDFMAGLFEVASPEISLGREPTAGELLDLGAERISARLDEQPMSRSRLLRAMGKAYHGLGRYERASELLREAIEDRRQAVGPSHPEVAECLLDLARAQISLGDPTAAEQSLQASLAICDQQGPAADPLRAATLNLLAQVRQRQGDIAQAERLHRQAVELNTRLLGTDHLVTLESLNDLAEALAERRQFARANELYRQVLDGQRRQLSSVHPDVIKTLNNLATAQLAAGDPEASETSMRRVVAARRQLYGEDHPHVALAYSNLGQVLSSQGRHAEALQWLDSALELSVKHYGEAHPRVADLTYNVGFVLEELGRLDAAEQRMSQALTLRRAAHGSQHPAVAQSLVALAGLHHRMGRTDEAITEARESLRILRDALPADDYRQSSPQLQLGLLLTAIGRCDEALPLLERAVALRRSYLPEEHPALAAAVAALRACS